MRFFFRLQTKSVATDAGAELDSGDEVDTGCAEAATIVSPKSLATYAGAKRLAGDAIYRANRGSWQ